MRHQHSFTTASATSIAGRVRRGAGNRKAGKVLNPVRRKIEGQQDGPVTALCGDGDPVARATVHSHTGSWDIGGSGDKIMSRCGWWNLPILY